MAKVLKDLFLAMLNATLILVAVCLVLMIMLVNRANNLTATFAENLNVVAPLQDSIKATGAEVAALRSDLATLGSQSRDASSVTLSRIQDRVAVLETRLEDIQKSAASLRDAPARLLDQAIEQAADQAVISVARIRQCVPPDSTPPDNS